MATIQVQALPDGGAEYRCSECDAPVEIAAMACGACGAVFGPASAPVPLSAGPGAYSRAVVHQWVDALQVVGQVVWITGCVLAAVRLVSDVYLSQAYQSAMPGAMPWCVSAAAVVQWVVRLVLTVLVAWMVRVLLHAAAQLLSTVLQIEINTDAG